MNRESGRDRDSQMIPGARTQSSVANPAYGTRTCTAEFAPRRARNDCAKTGTVSSGAQTGGETGGVMAVAIQLAYLVFRATTQQTSERHGHKTGEPRTSPTLMISWRTLDSRGSGRG